jgi:ABC-2 type transport system permease protein
LTTPATRGQLIIGKMLARFVLGMIQFLIVFGVGLIFGLFMNFNFGNNPVGLLLVMAAFVLCVCALTLLLATLVSTDQQAGSITTFAALILAPIGGAWWSLDLEFIPDFMRQIAWISPVRWAMQGFNLLIFENASILDTLPYVGGLLALTVVLFVIAVRRFQDE